MYTTTSRDSEDKEEITYHPSKFTVWEKVFMAQEFPDLLCPSGITSCFVSLDLSNEAAGMPRSLQVGSNRTYCRLIYQLKAQLVPVDTSLVVDEDGKSMLRARKEIIFSPALSVAAAPIFNTQIEFEKKCGVRGKKICRASLNIANSIYKAGDWAEFNLQIDNSKIKHECRIYIEQ